MNQEEKKTFIEKAHPAITLLQYFDFKHTEYHTELREEMAKFKANEDPEKSAIKQLEDFFEKYDA